MNNIYKCMTKKNVNEGIFDPKDPEYYSDKGVEFDEDWDDMVTNPKAERDKRLGSNADDVFDGNYDWYDSPDEYFDKSDYRFTHDSSGIREPNTKWGEFGRGIYGNYPHQDTFESKRPSMKRKDVRKLVEDTIREALKSGMLNHRLTEAGIPLSEFNYDGEDTEMNPFEEYEKGYPKSDFDPSRIDKRELMKWCQNSGDFLYIYNMPLHGWRISCANSSEIQTEIVGDIAKCVDVEPSHDMDWLMMRREREFEYFYVAVMKLSFQNKSEDYYIVYEVEKDDGYPMESSKHNNHKKINEDNGIDWNALAKIVYPTMKHRPDHDNVVDNIVNGQLQVKKDGGMEDGGWVSVYVSTNDDWWGEWIDVQVSDNEIVQVDWNDMYMDDIKNNPQVEETVFNVATTYVEEKYT